MRTWVGIFFYLVCVLSATAEEEWKKVGNWTALRTTYFSFNLVEVQYDRDNVMFPGFGRPEPSMDFILLVLYPQNMSRPMVKDAHGQWAARPLSPRKYLYLHVSAVETEGGVSFHVLRYKAPDGINPSYDGRELLQYQDATALTPLLSDPSQLNPLWESLRPIIQQRLQNQAK